jgi:hypothetical protein
MKALDFDTVHLGTPLSVVLSEPYSQNWMVVPDAIFNRFKGVHSYEPSPGLPHIPTFGIHFQTIGLLLSLPGSNRMYISIPAHEKKGTVTLK